MGLEERFLGLQGSFFRGGYSTNAEDLRAGVGAGDSSVRYGLLDDGKPRPDEDHVWFMSDYLSGGDYGASLVHRSNYEVIVEEANRLAEEMGDNSWFQTFHGSHGSYGVAFHVIRTPDELIEMIPSDYPLISDDHHSKLEVEAQDEAWERWAASEFRSELEKKFRGDAAEVADTDLYESFHAAMEDANVYWVNEEGDSMYIDMKRIMKSVDEPPPGFVLEDEGQERLKFSGRRG